MTKAQISSILASIGETQDEMTDFEGTNLKCINLSKYENKTIKIDGLQFKFNSGTEILECYPFKKEKDKEIKYLTDGTVDGDGNLIKVCDYYSYDSIHSFIFEGEYEDEKTTN